MKSKKRTKRLIRYFLIISIIISGSLVTCLIYPSIKWDINFLMQELLFRLNNNNLKQIKNQDTIPKCPNCNVILVSFDTLRADRLGCYGYSRNTSPNIDKLTEESIIFKKMFSNAYWTLPSHMSMFTSLYPLTHKINDKYSGFLSSRFKTFAEILAEEGYQPIWSSPLPGPYINTPGSIGRGFDNQGFNNFYQPIFYNQKRIYNESNKDLSSILKQVINKKFFLFIHSYVNHAPYVYPEEFNHKFLNPNYSGNFPRNMTILSKLLLIKMKKDLEMNPNSFLNNFHLTSEQKIRLINSLNTENIEEFTYFLADNLYNNLDIIYDSLDSVYYDSIKFNPSSEDISELQNSYDCGVYYVDYLFGEFLNELKENGLLEKTIIILTADHGEELFEHYGFDHKNFYDHTISVPLIIRVPGLKTRIEIGKLTQSIDIIPTVLNLLDLKTPVELQGKNILDYNGQDNEYTYGYSLGDIYIRSEKWKYIKKRDGEEELYYLLNDPLEQNNLIYKKSIIIKKYKGRFKDEITKWMLKQS